MYKFKSANDRDVEALLNNQLWISTLEKIPDDSDQNNDYEPTYRDGSLKNECWNDRAYRDNSTWRDDQ